MIRIFFCFLLIILSTGLYSQDIEVPYNIIQAINKKTRTDQGIPGIKYFQNFSQYKMKVKVNPSNGLLKGSAEITYHNNSRDTLGYIILKLCQNIFKPGVPRNEEVNPLNINDGMVITYLKIDGKNITGNSNRFNTLGTIFKLYLSEQLCPYDSCKIEIEWNYELPHTPVHRFGKYAESTHFIAYWYPQVAVYDDIDGWDEDQYNGTQETYNDFSNYQVEISLPPNMLVWATGEWMNYNTILKTEIANRLQKAKVSDQVIHIINQEDINNKSVFTSGPHTFHYFANQITDFAFAISDHYLWDGTSVNVDSSKKERVFVSAAFPLGSKNFEKVDSLAREIVQRLTFESYGLPFPFPAITVFNGDNGMEFPMIVNNGSMNFMNATIYLTLHEIAHAYFPFMTGINERKYSWVDEGLTCYLPIETQDMMKTDYYSTEFWVNKYNAYSGTDADIPLVVPAYQTRDFSYQFYSYNRPFIAFNMLEYLIGRDTFRLAIRNFINTWEGKHPTGFDLLLSIEKTSGQNLGWFINTWFFQSGYPDLSIKNAKITNDSVYVNIVKTGKFPVPVFLKFTYDNGDVRYIERNLIIWKEKEQIEIAYKLNGKLKKIELGNSKIPDKNNRDNFYTF